MDAKEGFLILLNLAILGTVIAAAVYIFQIGNGNRSIKCTALDKFGDTCTGMWLANANCKQVGETSPSACTKSYQTINGISNQCKLVGEYDCQAGAECIP